MGKQRGIGLSQTAGCANAQILVTESGYGNAVKKSDDIISALLAEAAALRAWTHFFNRFAPEAASLRNWREAVRAMEEGPAARRVSSGCAVKRGNPWTSVATRFRSGSCPDIWSPK